MSAAPEPKYESITVLLAVPAEYEQVGIFSWALLVELFPEQKAKFDRLSFVRSAVSLLSAENRVWALVAKDNGRVVGILTLNECAAIYAGGVFGEISELYVLPEYRNAAIGGKLLKAADGFARSRNWPFLEVGTPGQPRWQRTLDFYLANGFSLIGPRLERNVGTI
jgi:GNAT superfamily N-acetyltransferase